MARYITITKDQRTRARNALIQESNSYLLAVEEWADEGFRPATCFHGTNLWTDYDNICGPCEDSIYDPRWHKEGSEEFEAEVEAWADTLARRERYEFILTMVKEGAQDLNTRSDLVRLKTLIQAALDTDV